MAGSNRWALTVARAKIDPSGHSPLTIRSPPGHRGRTPVVLAPRGAARDGPVQRSRSCDLTAYPPYITGRDASRAGPGSAVVPAGAGRRVLLDARFHQRLQ